MPPEMEQLLESLKVAQAPTEMARLTIKLLRVCGIYNVQGVGYELARLSVTNSPE